MKNLTTSCLMLIGIFINEISYSQPCTPDPGCPPDSLICPAESGGGCQGNFYSQTVTFSLPDNFMGVTMVDITLNSLSGLPPGLALACNPADCVFPGNTRNCISITGT